MTGIQTGPRQLELPPNMPSFESQEDRALDTPDRRTCTCRDVLGESAMGSDSIRAQEFALIQHGRQYPAQIGFIQNRSQASILVARLEWVMNESC